LPSCLPSRLVVRRHIDAANTLGHVTRLAQQELRAVYSGPSALEEASQIPSRRVISISHAGMDDMKSLNASVGRRRKNSVLIAITGWGQQEDRERSTAAGFDHHLLKPVDGAVLHPAAAALPDDSMAAIQFSLRGAGSLCLLDPLEASPSTIQARGAGQRRRRRGLAVRFAKHSRVPAPRSFAWMLTCCGCDVPKGLLSSKGIPPEKLIAKRRYRLGKEIRRARIDVLVNNAAIQPPASYVRVDELPGRIMAADARRESDGLHFFWPNTPCGRWREQGAAWC